MAHDIEQELLQLDDARSESAAAAPPFVRIELRIARPAHDQRRMVPFQGSAQHPPKTTCVVGMADYDDRPELELVAPRREHAAFVLGPHDVANDPMDLVDPQ